MGTTKEAMTAGAAVMRHKNSEKPAVICEERSLSYKTLCSYALNIAVSLISKGIKKGDRVAIDVKRSEDYLSLLVGISLAGVIGVTLHKGWSEKHRDHIISDSAPIMIIDDEILSSLKEAGSLSVSEKEAKLPEITESDPLFIIYTSGSTGMPKGSVVSNALIRNSCSISEKNLRNYSIGTRCDRILIDFNFSYVAGNYFSFLALCNGMTAVLASENEIGSPALLGECIKRNKVDYQYRVPSWMLNALKDPVYREAVKGIKVCDIGGEMLTDSTVRAVKESMPEALVYCSYGSTEAVMVAERLYVPAEQDLLGNPCENVRIYILDENGKPVQKNSSGELCIGGPAGDYGYYWNAPELTASKYVIHSEYGRLFHTGDRVKVEPDGRLRLIGRNDGMVKLHGQRIETELVEKAFLSFPGIWEAAVVLQGDSEHQMLVGFYTAELGTTTLDEKCRIEESALRRHLAKELPYYMIPSYLTEIDHMPLNSSGKLDRNSLPVIVKNKSEYVSPQTEKEKIISDAYAKYLNAEKVGRYDSFFELGGNSIIALQMLLYLSEHHKLNYSIRNLFTFPRVCDLAVTDTDQHDYLSVKAGVRTEKEIPDRILNLKYMAETEEIYPVDMPTNMLLFVSEAGTDFTPETVIRNRIDCGRSFTREEFTERVNTIIRRHPVLRSYFAKTENAGRWQIFNKEMRHEIYYKDIRGLSEAARENFVKGFFSVMDQTDDAFQSACFLTGEDSCIILFRTLHTLIDGMSVGILINELSCDALSDSIDGFYALRQKRLDEAEHFPEELKYYYKELDYTKSYRLPAPTEPLKVCIRELLYNKEETSRINKYCSSEGVSLSTYIEYCYGMGLLVALNTDEVWFGYTFSGRNISQNDRENILGNIMLSLPVRLSRRMLPVDFQQQVLKPLQYPDVSETMEYRRLNMYKTELGIVSRVLLPYDKNVICVRDDYGDGNQVGHFMCIDEGRLCIRLRYLRGNETDKAYDIIENTMRTYLSSENLFTET